MELVPCPRIISEKCSVPTIYLDTCAMIELAKHQRGNCTDAHKQEIGELYDVLASMMQEKRIRCPLGNQLQEMGMTKDRKTAKLFLYRFTNSELLHPDLVQNAQMQAGYRAFANNDAVIKLGLHTAFEENNHPESPFVIHASPVYSPEKAETLRCEKYRIVNVLNEMKASKKVKPNFEAQLQAELEAEIQLLFNNALENAMSSEDAFARYLDEMEKFYRITGFNPNCTPEQLTAELIRYGSFLISPYHDLLPYIWIRASLWSHLMQRPNRIAQGDNLDIQWAAAYLPFIDYAVTDDSFCKLLQNSGLAELYGTKVYSFRTLGELLRELRCRREADSSDKAAAPV